MDRTKVQEAHHREQGRAMIQLAPDSSDQLVRRRLHPGVTLPDGSVLTFGADTLCPCINCVRAFEALDAGQLSTGWVMASSSP